MNDDMRHANKALRIVISVNAAWNVWNFRRPLVEALLAAGHTVTILAPQDDTFPRLRAMGCQVRNLEMNVKGLNPMHDYGLLRRFTQIFAELRPDVILSFTIKNNIFGALAAKSAGIPFVPNVTGLGTAFLSGGLLRTVAVTLYRTAFRSLAVVFFQNADDRALFVELGLVNQEQARILPGSGIDLKHFARAPYPTQDSAPIFLMIARLLRDKGVLEYVEAARNVKSDHPEARFQILGATDAHNRTAIDHATVQEWEEAGIIEYLGTVEDVRPAIAAAHCVVLPSYREGAPRTLIEAAAMGRPVIATDVPGCRAVLEEGHTGFFCDVRSGESLAGACAHFLALSQKQRAAIGEAGRAKMEAEFDQKIVVDAYRAALRDVISGGQVAA